MMKWVDLITALCGAISVGLPLLIAFYKKIKALAKEKNYAKILKIMQDAAAEAENLYKDKAERREYVLNILKVTCDSLKIDYDEEKLDKELTDFIAATKKINTK